MNDHGTVVLQTSYFAHANSTYNCVSVSTLQDIFRDFADDDLPKGLWVGLCVSTATWIG